jgi:hypothetical protein
MLNQMFGSFYKVQGIFLTSPLRCGVKAVWISFQGFSGGFVIGDICQADDAGEPIIT